jgi:hypothetical protein
MFTNAKTSSGTPAPAAIIPVRPAADAVPAADTSVRTGLLRRTLGAYHPSRRTFGRGNASRRTFGRGNPSRRTFGRGNASRRTFGLYHPSRRTFGVFHP